MNRKPSFDGLVTALNLLTDEEKCALVDSPQALKTFAGELVVNIVGNTYFKPMSDQDLPERLQSTAIQERQLATELGYPGPVAWKVRAGVTLKQHEYKAGPCYKQFEYLQDWQLNGDEPTSESIVFWIPRLVSGSTSKRLDEQMELLTSLRKRFKLPAHHLSTLGSAALIAGLILAHFKRIGERVPINNYWVRTDTCGTGGSRLCLGGFDETGLGCGGWGFDEECNGDLGVFALGVEELGR
jgi:hypothetical protein